MKKVYFLIQGWDHPASRYRVLQYLPSLQEAQIVMHVALFPNSFFQWMKLFSELKDYHTIFIQKKRLWHWQLWYLRRKRIRIIYDFDDAIMFKSPVDGGGRSFKRQRTFARMVRCSDQIIAGNQYLKSKAIPYNKNIAILPTAIDTRKYTTKDYRRSKEKITIGWIGSKSSLPFLKELTPAFDHVASQYKSVELKIICNDFFECKRMSVIKKRWALKDENADLQDIDIGLAPLPDHEWTKGKCATKLLQYLSVGIPVVCSPVGVHNEIIQEGMNGLFAASTQEWIEKVSLLIKDKALRERIGLEGKKTVEFSYSLKANIPKFISIIKEL
ncbi:MAG: glycosyltransferase [Candidatus Brocadia sp. AMX2]|nr:MULTISPECIES: glycosyltransferase family 4 protein [Brocadia]MBC6930928.1 glycosyltransferase [Candidatus Brocadia sp.]MBL1167918.1 glycosyltransferase [Candidatus Brocadia sp. AMX1]NOG41522.1 glycosyltransferase family 4 protein [Planctomycetota bacterium]KAA0245361.1 MAG: glycosyltransferase [Candidatus Brocadia sp. AMX2]MCE7865612.1 glycosyltransferase [Candidatus Brocadia sp. AMX2]